MSYIQFNKNKLVNFQFSSEKELLRCSKYGAYACTSLARLNTRKYHGLFIVPQDDLDGEDYILLSNLDETILQNNMEFRLGTHQYKGGFINPKGYKYLQDFNCDVSPVFIYNIGKTVIKKELVFLTDEDRLIIKYSLEEGDERFKIVFKPFLAFRKRHELTHENPYANTEAHIVENGVSFCLYKGFSNLYIQTDSSSIYNHQPSWYKNIEYAEELKRGYDGVEDLLVPGNITIALDKKHPVYITVGTTPVQKQNIKKLFTHEIKSKTSRDSFFNCLKNAAQQFIIQRNNKTEIKAGYPWFGRWGRDTFIALPGLTLALDDPQTCKKVIDTMVSELNGALFPNIGQGETSAYNSVDAPLWFFWALQQYAIYTKSQKRIWKEYGSQMKNIINGYKSGCLYGIKMLDNGLIYAGEEGKSLTWMDACINGQGVTPRTGCPVEINALWYNALCFSIEVALLAKDVDFVSEWQELTTHFPETFKNNFWDKKSGYLADYTNGHYKNFQVRPNMLIAASLPYTPLTEKIRQLIVKKAQDELLTNRGLRTLSPKDPEYKGNYSGNQASRDLAYHQGTVWPWLFGPFAEAYLKIYQSQGVNYIEEQLKNIESSLFEYGISTIGEVYDGDPPHKAGGCISQAWSVAEILRIMKLVESYKKK